MQGGGQMRFFQKSTWNVFAFVKRQLSGCYKRKDKQKDDRESIELNDKMPREQKLEILQRR